MGSRFLAIDGALTIRGRIDAQPTHSNASFVAARDASCGTDRFAMVAASPAMQCVVRRGLQAAGPLLLLGDTGTGKQRLARWIHVRGPQFSQPFVPVYCDAIDTHRLVDRIFGTSYSSSSCGRSTDRGLVEQAASGMFYLRNIDRLPGWFQRLFAESIRTGVFVRRDCRAVRLTARVVASVSENRSADSLTPDLRQCFATSRVRLPALRERREDLRPLVQALVSEAAADRSFNSRWPRLLFSSGAIERFERYDWPGNVRELHNVVRRLDALAKEPLVTEADVAEWTSTSASPIARRTPRGGGIRRAGQSSLRGRRC